jgi:hypothetical protein
LGQDSKLNLLFRSSLDGDGQAMKDTSASCEASDFGSPGDFDSFQVEIFRGKLLANDQDFPLKTTGAFGILKSEKVPGRF